MPKSIKRKSTPSSSRTQAPTTGAEAQELHKLLKNREFPPGVKRIQFEFDEDSSGEPAVWIVLVTDDDLDPSEDKLSRINDFANQLKRDILKQRRGRWPYIRIITE
jgi:hypothetical protein